MRRKDGELDYTGGFSSSYGNIPMDESMFTSYAVAEDGFFQRRRRDAEEKFQKYLQKDYEKRMKRAQLISSIVAAAGSMMMSYGLQGMSAQASVGANAQAGVADGTIRATTAQGQAALEQAASQGNRALGNFLQTNANQIEIVTKGAGAIPLQTAANTVTNLGTGMATDFVGPVQQTTSGLRGLSNISATMSNSGIQAVQRANRVGLFQRLFSSGANIAGKMTRNQKGGLIGFNSGGFVPHGSRLSDTIPALLTGGEYVMNNSAVKKYGLKTLNSMNAGAYQSGGEYSSSSTTNNNNTNNSTNISIKVDRAGNSTYTSNDKSYEKNDVDISKDMAKKINALVVKTISNEKRYGGEIYKDEFK